jgi:Protein of unknown function (DUF2905)
VFWPSLGRVSTTIAEHKAIATGWIDPMRRGSYFYEITFFGPKEPRMSRMLILLGLLLIAVGLLWPWIGSLGLGHLPGDIIIERKNFTLYVPIATGLLFSVVLTLLLWLVN